MQQQLVECHFERHADAILAIFNEAIVHSTALYDYQPRTPQNMVAWFEAKRKGNFPVVGIEDEQGKLLAFGSYGSFRAWPAYKYTVEHSVYVHKEHRGQGLGRQVLQLLIARAREQALGQLRREAGELALQVAGRILERKLDADADRALADRLIRDLE